MNTNEIPAVIRAKTADATFRYGIWGPSYLLDSETCRIGIVRLRPGDEVENHLHEQSNESFIVISGKAELWVNRSKRAALVEGDVAQCVVGSEHYLKAVGNEDFVAYFIKSPVGGDDTREVPWSPQN